MKKTLAAVLGGCAVCLLSACNGIFGNIYDTAEPSDETSAYGFVKPCTDSEAGRIYIDTQDYTQWVYLDFEAQTTAVAAVADEAPEAWDIALHRYDVKTHDGRAAETSYSDLSKWVAAGRPAPAEEYADIWSDERIMTDLSHMMDSIIVYTPSYYNPCLSRWLDVDLRTMPPIYKPSNRVYTVRFDDGRGMALRFLNYMDDRGAKGYIMIDYLYPVSF